MKTMAALTPPARCDARQVQDIDWSSYSLRGFSLASSGGGGGGLWGRLQRAAAWGQVLLKHPQLLAAAPDIAPLLFSSSP